MFHFRLGPPLVLRGLLSDLRGSLLGFRSLLPGSQLGDRRPQTALSEVVSPLLPKILCVQCAPTSKPRPQPRRQLLLKPKYSAVEKIKTIGSTYMAASGLQPGQEEDRARQGHNVITLVEFATALMAALDAINRESFQHFKLRTGQAGGARGEIWRVCCTYSAGLQGRARTVCGRL